MATSSSSSTIDKLKAAEARVIPRALQFDKYGRIALAIHTAACLMWSYGQRRSDVRWMRWANWTMVGAGAIYFFGLVNATGPLVEVKSLRDGLKKGKRRWRDEGDIAIFRQWQEMAQKRAWRGVWAAVGGVCLVWYRPLRSVGLFFLMGGMGYWGVRQTEHNGYKSLVAPYGSKEKMVRGGHVDFTDVSREVKKLKCVSVKGACPGHLEELTLTQTPRHRLPQLTVRRLKVPDLLYPLADSEHLKTVIFTEGDGIEQLAGLSALERVIFEEDVHFDEAWPLERDTLHTIVCEKGIHVDEDELPDGWYLKREEEGPKVTLQRG